MSWPAMRLLEGGRSESANDESGVVALCPGCRSPYRGEMDVQELLSTVTDNLTVHRVFGEPIVHGDVLMVPVARIWGGAGGGGSNTSNGGGGTGVIATPAGVYVIKNGSVSFQPALNVSAIVIGGQVVTVILALLLRSALRRRRSILRRR
jgi:uncharacterized spore protein YtfJ